MTHDQAKRALEAGTPPELVCATCPWDRLCVDPPKMSGAEIERKIKEAEQQDAARDPDGKKLPFSMLMTTVTLAGRDSSGALCPVFALRLRSEDGRKVADSIRSTMRGWTEDGAQ